jgi:hypothetical protein
MDLATHQRALLGLIRSTYQVRDDDEPYIQTVARSNDLQEARRNIFLWRLWVLERTCFLTCNLLKQRNLLDETLTLFMARENLSPFRETHAPAFLDMLSGHPDCLIAAVAQFELALMKVRQGDSGTFIVPWAVDPHSVLYSLARDLPLADSAPTGTYEIHISCDLPSQFEIRHPT